MQDPKFVAWMREANVQVMMLAGLSALDLADQTWWEWWDSGMTAREAAIEALEDEGFPFPDDFDPEEG